MLGKMVFLCLFVLSTFSGVTYLGAQHAPIGVILLLAAASALVLCMVVYRGLTDEYNRGRGMLKTEKELLEDGEIYETMGAVRLGVYDGVVVILRLRNGKLRACQMNEVPPEKVFKVREDSHSGKIEKYGYPPVSLRGKIVDIQA